MKKIVKLTISIAFMLLFGLMSKAVCPVYGSEKIVTSEYASYQEKEVLASNNLGYGIEHLKVNALSTANRCNNQSNTTLSPQVVNILSVPSRKDVRIVNYTYPNTSGWTKQTLSKVVENFEYTHPGWVVIAGINGDFYDINGNDKALPYHTTGSMMTDGELLRVVNSKSIGYTNDGSSNSFKSTDRLTFSDNHYLTIYDENDDVIGKYPISKLNSEPGENEISVYYSYKVNVKDESGKVVSANLIQATVPSSTNLNHNYIIEMPKRCLATDQVIYGTGEISTIDLEKKLGFGQFAIVTSNEEVQNLLSMGVNVRVQKDVTGDLADCDQIQAVGSTLMKDGIISTDNSDGMRMDRHPRTCIGVKEDGTLMFFVIDGRQQGTGMYGMTQDEQGVLMDYYGCYEGYNIDGGGSTTMGIRNEDGQFVIMNSPSDGRERLNANYILITVPELKLELSEQTDKSVKLSYGNLSKGIEVSNLEITIGDLTKKMDSQEFVFEGLTPETNYEIAYKYDICYSEMKSTKKGISLYFKTGKLAPKLINNCFDIDKNTISYYFSIEDINNLISLATLKTANELYFIDDFKDNKVTYNIKDISSHIATITINYKVASEPERSDRIVEILKWYPQGLNIDEYCKHQQKELQSIINSVNEKIETLSKDEVILEIEKAKLMISELSEEWENATCTTPKKCKVCGEIVGEALGHTLSDWIIDTNPTCTTDGKKHKECAVCKEIIQEDMEKLVHEWEKATCQAPKTCKLCGVTEGERLEHTESDWIIDTNPTCTTDGKKHKECAVCKEIIQEEDIEKLAHEWNDATCQAPKTCKLCGVTEGEKREHVEGRWRVDVQATCKEEGKQHLECMLCGENLKEEAIAKKEHIWNDATTESPKTCSVCGTTDGEKLPPKKKNCKKTSVAIILTSITLLCSTIYIIKRDN